MLFAWSQCDCIYIWCCAWFKRKRKLETRSLQRKKCRHDSESTIPQRKCWIVPCRLTFPAHRSNEELSVPNMAVSLVTCKKARVTVSRISYLELTVWYTNISSSQIRHSRDSTDWLKALSDGCKFIFTRAFLQVSQLMMSRHAWGISPDCIGTCLLHGIKRSCHSIGRSKNLWWVGCRCRKVVKCLVNGRHAFCVYSFHAFLCCLLASHIRHAARIRRQSVCLSTVVRLLFQLVSPKIEAQLTFFWLCFWVLGVLKLSKTFKPSI